MIAEQQWCAYCNNGNSYQKQCQLSASYYTKKYFQNNTTLWNNVLTEFSERDIEESYHHESEPSLSDNKDELYWTKGKWKEYLQQQEQKQNFEQESE